MMHKAANDNLPLPVLKCLTTFNPFFFFKTSRLKQTEKSVSFAGPKLWNCLPSELVVEPSYNIFKEKLRAHILNRWLKHIYTSIISHTLFLYFLIRFYILLILHSHKYTLLFFLLIYHYIRAYIFSFIIFAFLFFDFVTLYLFSYAIIFIDNVRLNKRKSRTCLFYANELCLSS